MKVLLVLAAPEIRQGIAAAVRDCGFTVFEAANGAQALEGFRSEAPDLVMLDEHLPGIGGLALVRAIRRLEASTPAPVERAPVMMLGDCQDDTALEQAVDAGADDYLCLPLRPALLRAKLKVLARVDELRQRLLGIGRDFQEANPAPMRLSWQDGLTGIANRRRFDIALEDAWRRACRSNRPLTLMLADIDYFKRYNDYYGQHAGDECLRRVASSLSSGIREGDFIARYGGEEFAMILSNTDLATAHGIGERVLDTLRELRRPHATSRVAEHVTVSLGVLVCMPSPDVDCAALLRGLEAALSRAKLQGRNRACNEVLLGGELPTAAAA